ncbi:diketogulonate reductase-like aldo/keto reductase [Chryseobacterium ginsenosidimutans]|uniref:aldo/keto reductase n=1 Tax=Chryseobacterium ginsenosidimutans TaxID=687846 RepID=UPI002780A752|nr:aldo/keto reductase [Chryseobacterium ginsenosidimutans]MDQ0595251.1 diketogulonate reductase-like aldo/keto reductase [Chryseobacterium ginsenosidimutans]
MNFRTSNWSLGHLLLRVKNNLFNNELLNELSIKHNKRVAQLILRRLMQKEVVAIPKSANMKRMNKNFNVFDFELSANNMATIKSLDKGSGLVYNI